MKKLNLFIVAILTVSFSLAQDLKKTDDAYEEKKEQYRPFHLSFVTPIGTNGFDSHKTINGVSINLLGGISAGVKFAEFGGIANVTLGDVSGAQFAGHINATLGNFQGGQFSGIANFNRKNFNGVQSSGVVGVNGGDFIGWQNAGIAVSSHGDVHGAQTSGVISVTTGNLKGAQLSGVVNVVTGEMTGLQAGLLNFSRTLNGFQLGLVNISDSVGFGTPIGLISFVRTGYHEFEIETNETTFLNANFKTGTERFYNIFSFGLLTRSEYTNFLAGLGFGTIVPINQKIHMDVDLTTRHWIDFDEEDFEDYVNDMIYTLGVSASYKITDNIVAFGGPTFNISVSNRTDSEGQIIPSDFVPYSFYNQTFDNQNVQMYVGFKAGFRF